MPKIPHLPDCVHTRADCPRARLDCLHPGLGGLHAGLGGADARAGADAADAELRERGVVEKVEVDGREPVLGERRREVPAANRKCTKHESTKAASRATMWSCE